VHVAAFGKGVGRHFDWCYSKAQGAIFQDTLGHLAAEGTGRLVGWSYHVYY